MGPTSAGDRKRPPCTGRLRINWRAFLATMDAETDGAGLPRFVVAEVDAFLRCGILAHGFVRLACEACREARLVAFSCKRRGFCLACIGRRMSERAAHLVDAVLPRVPVRQWVLTVPHGLRYRMADDPSLTTKVLNVFVRAISSWLKRRARKLRIAGTLKTGAVTVIQRFDSALALNVHFHTVVAGWRLRPGRPGTARLSSDAAANGCRGRRGSDRDLSQGVCAGRRPRVGPEPASALAACASASITRVAATGPRRGSPLRRISATSRRPHASWGAAVPRSKASTSTRTPASPRTSVTNWKPCAGTSRGHRCPTSG